MRVRIAIIAVAALAAAICVPTRAQQPTPPPAPQVETPEQAALHPQINAAQARLSLATERLQALHDYAEAQQALGDLQNEYIRAGQKPTAPTTTPPTTAAKH